jgi:hypothetical protein
MTDLAAAAEEFAALARRLKAAGEVELRRELYKAISDAAEPVGDRVAAYAYLSPYMPDHYAAVLSEDMKVTVSRLTGAEPAIRLVAKGSRHRRKLKRLNEGFLTHPLFGDREHWFTQSAPLHGMHAGFFTDEAKLAAPEIRRKILAAMHDVAEKVTRKA